MVASPKELAYFLEVCHTLNVSRASERLGISQPSLSNAIKKLEQSIGTHLLVRNKSGVSLTKAGSQLQAHAKQLLALWEHVKAESLASHEKVQGHFTFGCHPSVANHSLPRFFPMLINDFPRLEIKLVHDISRKILEGVINLHIDLGIVVNPIQHPDIILQRLYEDKVTIWCANALSEKTLTANNYDLIGDLELMQTQQLLKDLEQQQLFPRRIIPSSNLDVIAELTLAGTGYGILPKTVALRRGLHQVSNMPCFFDEIYLVYRPELRDVKAIQEIKERIIGAF